MRRKSGKRLAARPPRPFCGDCEKGVVLLSADGSQWDPKVGGPCRIAVCRCMRQMTVLPLPMVFALPARQIEEETVPKSSHEITYARCDAPASVSGALGDASAARGLPWRPFARQGIESELDTSVPRITIPRILWIECKGPDGKQSPAQRLFEEAAVASGHHYIVARSVDNVREWLAAHR